MGEENKNGLATETGGAEQIGQIFGKEMSKGQDSDSEYTGTIVVNNNIKDVKVDGTEVITVAVVGTTVIVGGIIYYCSDSEAAKTLGAAIEAKMKEEAGKAKKKIDLAVTIGAVIGVGVGKVFKSQVGIGETIPTPDTDPGAFKRGENDGSTGYEGEDGSWW